MGNLLDLSSRIIDSGVASEPVNRITNELSELAGDLAIVESFSHCVVFDTQGDGLVCFDASGVRTGPAVVDSVHTWRTDPVTTLVYTHGHLDHVGGSAAFAARADRPPTVIGHVNVDRRFDRYEYTNDWNRIINARQFGGVRGFGIAPPGGDRFVPSGTLRPDVTFTHRHTMELGGETIELRHARGETDDHLWAWFPNRRWIMAGDFVIWNFPNAGNPQKVQRYPLEWAAALREMIAAGADLLVPAHGLPIEGTERINRVLDDTASALERLVAEVVEMMNAGETLDTIIHSVSVPDDVLARPYLRPLYDEPEFVVRNVWRQFGGWWDGAPSRLKPAPDAQLAVVLAELSGGVGALVDRAEQALADGDLRIACHLVDLAAWAAPDDPAVHRVRARVYGERRRAESSLMTKGIFAAAARESEAAAGGD